LDNLDGLLARADEGLRRIQQIVRNLRGLRPADESELKEVDVNDGIASTLQVIRPRAREARVELADALAPLPPVTC